MPLLSQLKYFSMTGVILFLSTFLNRVTNWVNSWADSCLAAKLPFLETSTSFAMTLSMRSTMLLSGFICSDSCEKTKETPSDFDSTKEDTHFSIYAAQRYIHWCEQDHSNRVRNFQKHRKYLNNNLYDHWAILIFKITIKSSFKKGVLKRQWVTDTAKYLVEKSVAYFIAFRKGEFFLPSVGQSNCKGRGTYFRHQCTIDWDPIN